MVLSANNIIEPLEKTRSVGLSPLDVPMSTATLADPANEPVDEA